MKIEDRVFFAGMAIGASLAAILFVVLSILADKGLI